MGVISHEKIPWFMSCASFSDTPRTCHHCYGRGTTGDLTPVHSDEHDTIATAEVLQEAPPQKEWGASEGAASPLYTR